MYESLPISKTQENDLLKNTNYSYEAKSRLQSAVNQDAYSKVSSKI
jgi:hypothetical protein